MTKKTLYENDSNDTTSRPILSTEKVVRIKFENYLFTKRNPEYLHKTVNDLIGKLNLTL